MDSVIKKQNKKKKQKKKHEWNKLQQRKHLVKEQIM